jgi:hypothetical protein
MPTLRIHFHCSGLMGRNIANFRTSRRAQTLDRFRIWRDTLVWTPDHEHRFYQMISRRIDQSV